MPEVESTPLAGMTMKKMGCDPKEAIRQKGPVFMARIYGEAAALKTKESKSGDVYSYLIGTFAAITAGGEKYVADKLFLPGGLLENIEAALAAADTHAVQFGYDIFAQPDDGPIGYRYAAKTVIKSEAADRLKAMEDSLVAKPLPGAPTQKQVEGKTDKKK